MSHYADLYPGLVCEPSLGPPGRPDCSPPKADCCLQGTVAPQLTGCGLPKESLTSGTSYSLVHLDRLVDLGYLWGGGVEQVASEDLTLCVSFNETVNYQSCGVLYFVE